MNAEPVLIDEPAASPAPVRDEAASSFALVEGLALALIAALASTAIAGYRYGDSNHGITVPILKRFMDPSLYPGDAMVATADRFPTIFFPLLAALLPSTDWVPLAFFIGYVGSIAATLAAAYRIGRWCGGTMEAGLVAALFTFPIRVGLAGESVYRVAFSHSHVASALVLWAIVWFLEGRRRLPLLVLSLGAYNHLLYSAYMLVPLTMIVLWEGYRKERGPRETAKLLAAAILPLVPLAISMLGKSQPMTAEWLELLKQRSATHSFPSTWGQEWAYAAGFLMLGLLFASAAPRAKQTLFWIFLGGIALQFVVGVVFTEVHPVKAILQFQPIRSWRFLLVLLYGWIATGVVAGWRQGGLVRGAAVFTALVVCVANGFEPLLPIAILWNALLRRDTARWARLAAAGALVFVPGIGDGPLRHDMLGDYGNKIFTATAMGAAALTLVLVVSRDTRPRIRQWMSVAVLGLVLFWLTPDAYARARARWQPGAWSWRDIQDWARANTPRDAVFLTPPGEVAFRVFSERPIVGEVKDGTQQYFDDAFALEWGRRMTDLVGGLDQHPRRFLERSDAELLDLAARYGASYIVLPNDPPRPALAPAYRNRHFTAYYARPIG